MNLHTSQFRRRWTSAAAVVLALLAGCWPAWASVPALALQTVAAAQPQPPTQVIGYTVSGRVLCADTQHPARFAQVTLVPATNGGDGDRGRMAVGRTDLDGRFTINNVPPGDYFATADLTGYMDNAPAVRNALREGSAAPDAIATVPRVQVSAGGAAVQLSLERGAVLAGSVQWDDGSPASGVQVSAQPASATGNQALAGPQNGPGFGLGRPGNFGSGGQTDDRGHFRLSGLAPGSYVLRASVQSPLPQGSNSGGGGRFNQLVSLSVYAPDKLRRTDAAVLKLAAGEERADVNVVLGLGGMHTVAGQVSSAAAAVRSGSVLLTDQTDPSLNRRGVINPDGSFFVPYVPAGTYTLRVTASAQAANAGRGTTDSPSSSRFQPLQESITVTDSDLAGLAIAVTAANATP